MCAQICRATAEANAVARASEDPWLTSMNHGVLRASWVPLFASAPLAAACMFTVKAHWLTWTAPSAATLTPRSSAGRGAGKGGAAAAKQAEVEIQTVRVEQLQQRMHPSVSTARQQLERTQVQDAQALLTQLRATGGHAAEIEEVSAHLAQLCLTASEGKAEATALSRELAEAYRVLATMQAELAALDGAVGAADVMQALDLAEAQITVAGDGTLLHIASPRLGIALTLRCGANAGTPAHQAQRCTRWAAALRERGEAGAALRTALAEAKPTAPLCALINGRIDAVAAALRVPPPLPQRAMSVPRTAAPALREAMASAARMAVWLRDDDGDGTSAESADDRYALRLLLLISTLTIAQRAAAIDAAAEACAEEEAGVVAKAALAATVCTATRVLPRPDDASVAQHLGWLRGLRSRFARAAVERGAPTFLEVCAIVALCVVEARERQLAVLIAGEGEELPGAMVGWVVRAFGLAGGVGEEVERRFVAGRAAVSRAELRMVLNECAFAKYGGPFLVPTRGGGARALPSV